MPNTCIQRRLFRPVTLPESGRGSGQVPPKMHEVSKDRIYLWPTLSLLPPLWSLLLLMIKAKENIRITRPKSVFRYVEKDFFGIDPVIDSFWVNRDNPTTRSVEDSSEGDNISANM